MASISCRIVSSLSLSRSEDAANQWLTIAVRRAFLFQQSCVYTLISLNQSLFPSKNHLATENKNKKYDKTLFLLPWSWLHTSFTPILLLPCFPITLFHHHFLSFFKLTPFPISVSASTSISWSLSSANAPPASLLWDSHWEPLTGTRLHPAAPKPRAATVYITLVPVGEARVGTHVPASTTGAGFGLQRGARMEELNSFHPPPAGSYLPCCAGMAGWRGPRGEARRRAAAVPKAWCHKSSLAGRCLEQCVCTTSVPWSLGRNWRKRFGKAAEFPQARLYVPRLRQSHVHIWGLRGRPALGSHLW